jgi:hypothetical protein
MLWKLLLHPWASSGCRKPTGRSPVRLIVESLEDRLTPAGTWEWISGLACS